MEPTTTKPLAKIKPLLGLIVAILITVVGMLSVYVAGNARGYDPSMTVLVRNVLLMCFFLVVYSLLKRNYKGDFTILVVVAFLTGIGFIVQYRISAAINVGFQETLVKQYSAAIAKQDSVKEDSGEAVAPDTTAVGISEERKLETIRKEAEQLLKLEKLNFRQLLGQFFGSIPGWSRLIVSYLIALLSIVYLVKKCSSDKFMDSLAQPFFWVTLTIFLLFVFVALSEVKTRGRFVYQMTPWEAFKITIIIFLAGFFAKYKDEFTRNTPKIKGKRVKNLLIPWGPFVLIWLVPQLLFVLLKDFGQVILYGGLVIIMIFVLTRKYIYLFGGIAITVVTSKVILLLEGIAPPHVLQRFLIWSDIWAPPRNEAWWDNVYQIMNSFFALNAGGLTGSGLGLGYPTNIPLVVSDFVYSAISEELGFLGAVAIVMLYLLLFFLGIRVALESENDFEKMLATGFTTILALQVFVNIGGVVKLIPLTGITLPFISRGGFSFLISTFIIGLLMGLSHRNGKRIFSV
ncbi:MAG: FtsW/RodA/SpoVE family cell cycle protein [bacterium]